MLSQDPRFEFIKLVVKINKMLDKASHFISFPQILIDSIIHASNVLYLWHDFPFTFLGKMLLQDWCFAMESVLKMELPWRTMRSKLVKCDSDDEYVQYNTTFEECQIRHRYSGVSVTLYFIKATW